MPKHDETPLEEIEEGIRENIRLGYVVEVSPGQFKLTPAGIEHVEGMIGRGRAKRK